jgi:nucleoid DNA-binding protein
MLKTQLVEVVAAKCSITSRESETILNTFIEVIYDTLAKISGFGKFRTFPYKGRIGGNPRNPTVKMEIRGRRIPKFTPGEAFKKAVAIKK